MPHRKTSIKAVSISDIDKIELDDMQFPTVASFEAKDHMHQKMVEAGLHPDLADIMIEKFVDMKTMREIARERQFKTHGYVAHLLRNCIGILKKNGFKLEVVIEENLDHP